MARARSLNAGIQCEKPHSQRRVFVKFSDSSFLCTSQKVLPGIAQGCLHGPFCLQASLCFSDQVSDGPVSFISDDSQALDKNCMP